MSKGRVALIAAAFVMLSGCASTIMKNYVGQPLQIPMLDYGTPANAFDMPDGSRAFQWVLSSTYTPPVTATNTGNAYAVGNSVLWTQRTQINGGQPITSQCAYTMFARWDDAQNAWVITGFRKPKLMCE
jgi:hypothetical protein